MAAGLGVERLSEPFTERVRLGLEQGVDVDLLQQLVDVDRAHERVGIDPLDEAIDASYDVGRSLPSELRCTARGGCAVTQSALAMPRLR